MKLKSPILGVFAVCLLCAAKPSLYAESRKDIGVVNFATCVTESKLGKHEQEAMENIKNQVASLIKDIEDQLQDATSKLNDSDYLDGLSPEGEQELKMKCMQLREDHDRYQAQFYQIMQQANVKLVQTVSSFINTATEKIAKAKKLSLVVNRDACFSFDENFDITELVIDEMDKAFDQSQSQEVSKAEKSANEEEESLN